MLVGLLSDTHDHPDAMRTAMQLLRDAGAEYFLHGGDVGGERILDLFAGLQAAFVWGNNDWDRPNLSRYAETLHIKCLDDFGELELGGKLFALTHGDDSARIKKLLVEQRHDYLITGHTHLASDKRSGRVRWINPGALYRARPKTVALLDTVNDALRTMIVER